MVKFRTKDPVGVEGSWSQIWKKHRVIMDGLLSWAFRVLIFRAELRDYKGIS